VGKLLFIDNGLSGEDEETLRLAGRIAGPSWIVAASELSAADFDGVSVVALGGRVDEIGAAALARAVRPFVSEIAARPYVVYSPRSTTQECLATAAKILAVAVGKSAALRGLLDRSVSSPLPGPELMTHIEAFIAAHKTCALATSSPEGTPRARLCPYASTTSTPAWQP
jgi:hypothetical protein